MDQLLTLLTDEVTNNVNSALGTSTVQDRGLLVSEDRTYKTPKDKLIAMVRQRESLTNGLLESNQDQLNDDRTFLPGQDIFLVRSPSTLQKDVQEILEKEAQELSGDSSSLIHDSEKSAASIVRTISDERASEESVDPTPVPGHSGTKLLWLHKVTQELKSFFLMCFSKAAICRCLRRLYCLCGHSPPSSSEVQNLTNEALRFLMQEPSNQDVYESTISGLNDAMAMGDGLSEESWSSWELSESLTRPLQPWIQNLEFRRAAHE
uniref:Uncharacterized protein n=1 Tax=Knipowitschia caucasica TaxID=637954 RepID=A0AAV2LN98_KNICA